MVEVRRTDEVAAYAIGLLYGRFNFWMQFSFHQFLVGASYQQVPTTGGNRAHSIALMIFWFTLSVSWT